MRKSQPLSVPGLLLAVAIGTLFAGLALLKPLEGMEWRLFDRCLVLFPSGRAPKDFLVIGPGTGKAAGDTGAGDAFRLLKSLDEFRVGGILIEGELFSGGAEKEELEAIRSAIPGAVDEECGNIEENVRTLISGIRSGSIKPKDLGRCVDSLVAGLRESGQRVKEIAAEGSASSLGDLEAELAILGPLTDSFPAIRPDPDGVTRRLQIVAREGSRLVARAELSAMMERLGSGSFRLEPGRVIVIGARFPDGQKRDIAIPVDASGSALIRWPLPGSDAAPRRLAVEDLLEASRVEERFILILKKLEAGGFLVGEGYALLSRYRHAEELGAALGKAGEPAANLETAGGLEAARADWRDARRDFFASAERYFADSYDKALIAELEGLKDSLTLTPDELGLFEGRIAEVTSSYAEARSALADLGKRRMELAQALPSSFVFLSMTGKGMPLLSGRGGHESPAYAGAVFSSSILSGASLGLIPDWARVVSALVAILLSGLACALIGARGPKSAIGAACAAAGMVTALCLAAIALSLACFAFLGLYAGLLPPVLGIAASGIAAFALSRPRLSPEAEYAKRKVVVVACKASGFSRSVSDFPPEAMARALSSIHDLVRVSVEAHGGEVASADGAFVTAWFAAEAGKEAPGKRALSAVLEMRNECLKAPPRKAGDGPALNLSFGLDSGECLVADAGGSEPPARGGILGPAADLARRLADLNSHYGTHVLAAESVAAEGVASDGIASGGIASGGVAAEEAGEAFVAQPMGEIKAEETGRAASIFTIGKKQG